MTKQNLDNIDLVARELADPDTSINRKDELRRWLDETAYDLNDLIDPDIDNVSGEVKPTPLFQADAWFTEVRAQAAWKAVHGNVEKPTDEAQPWTMRKSKEIHLSAIEYWTERADREGWTDLLDQNDRFNRACQSYQFFRAKEILANLELEEALENYLRVWGKPYSYKPYAPKQPKRVGDEDRAALELTKQAATSIVSRPLPKK